MQDIKARVDLKREFGRVISHPERHNGEPFLNGTGITVSEILGLIEQGKTDQEILDSYSNLKQLHIDICRAYQARFLAETQPNLAHLDENNKIFMLDENVSYLILPDIARLFGWSSHVLAEGLYQENNDDEKHIWAHMLEHGYKAILTEDSDFKRISRNHRRRILETYGSIKDSHEPAPVVIYVSKRSSRQETVELLEKYKDQIAAFLKENDAACMTVSKGGTQKIATDEEILASMRNRATEPAQTSPSTAPA